MESALHSLDGVSVRQLATPKPFHACDSRPLLQEGVALRALGLSPYAGTFLHAPPLVQLALGALLPQR